MEQVKPKVIDKAIDISIKMQKKHAIRANWFLVILISMPVAFGALYSGQIFGDNSDKSQTVELVENEPENQAKKEEKAPVQFYIVTSLGVFVFIVFLSFYRLHQKHSDRYESFVFDLYRIQIAANNSEEGYQSEVRTSLTQNTFTFNDEASIFSKKKIENPVPGHPTVDLATIALNRLFDAIEVTIKKDKSDKPK